MATLIVLIIFILLAVLAYVVLVLLQAAHERRSLAELQRQEAEWRRLDRELGDWDYAALYERYEEYPDWQVASTMSVATASTLPVTYGRVGLPVDMVFEAPPRAELPLEVPGAD